MDSPVIEVQDNVSDVIAVPENVSATNVVPTNPDDVQQRAFRISQGYPEYTEQEAAQAIFEGREGQVRQQAAAANDIRRQAETQTLIQKAAELKGSPLTPKEHQFMLDKAILTQIQGLNVPTDPNVVFEEFFAGQYLKSSIYDVAGRLPEGFMAAAIKEEPGMVREIDRNANSLMTKQELLRTKIVDLKEIAKNQAMFNYIDDVAKDAIPFYFQLKMRQGELGDGLLLGTNVREQGKDLFRQDVGEFKRRIDDLDRIAKDNPSLAVQLAENLLNFSDNDELLYNLITPLEFMGWGGLGRSLVGRFKTAANVTTAYRDVLKAANASMQKASIPEAAGDLVESTVQRTMQAIREEVNQTGSATLRARESLQSYWRNLAWNYGMNRGGGSRELLNRVEQNMDLFAQRLEQLYETTLRVARIPSVLETETALKAVIADIRDFYPKRFIANISNLEHEAFTNTYSTKVTVHRPDGQLFRSEEVARNYARDPTALARPDARILQEGQGWKIEFDHQLRETDPVIRNLLIPAPGADVPPTWSGLLRSTINTIRTPDDVNLKQNVLNRKVATYAQAEFMRLFKEQGNYIRDLSRGVNRFDPVTGQRLNPYLARPIAFGKKLILGDDAVKQRWDQWESVVKFSNEAQDPATRKMGYFFQQQGELDAHYLQHFGRMPDPVEVEAYFAMRNLREAGRSMENLNVLTKKLRIGTEQHKVYMINEDGTRLDSKDFEGIVRKNTVPSNSEAWVLLGTQTGQEHIYGPGNPISPTHRAALLKRIKRGEVKVIEILEPGTRPLEGFSSVQGARIRYIVAPYAETRPINFEQVPMTGAFKDFPYDFTVSQAKIKSEQLGSARVPTYWYEGDTHVAGTMVRAQGKNYAKHMNEIQRLIRENKIDEAKVYSNRHMSTDWDEMLDKFRKGVYSLEEPFQVVSRNKKIIDLQKDALDTRYTRNNPEKNGRPESMLRDGTRTGPFAGQTSVFGDDLSDVIHINDVGSKLNPVFDHSAAKVIDPIPANDRALTKLVNSLFMDDYKFTSVEHWIKQATPFLKASEFELQTAPFYHFHNANWKSFKGDIPAEIKTDLLTQKRNIDQLIGTPSVLENGLHRLAQSLFDAAYEGLGPKRWIDPEWVLPKLTDPARFFRGVVFHATMGFYNVAQMAVQMNTFVNIFAFAGPKFASQGTAGATLHGLSVVNRNPAMLKAYDNIAVKLGYKPGEWMEAMQHLDRVGFKQVQGENILRDTQIGAQTVSGATNSFLDAGTYFWRKAEKAVRIGAWYTAHREYRDTVKTAGRLTDQDLRVILDRADFLAANMSRASASVIHTGVFSIPSQFFAYQIRIAEAFWSSARMGSWASEQGVKNRARVLATYGIAYGAPATIGVTGIPAYDHIRESALKHGYQPGDDFLRSLFHEGVLATTLALATGNWYNVSDRYALQGMEILKDILRGEKGFFGVIGGAAGTKAASILEASSPFVRFTTGFLTGENVSPSIDHAIDIFREISSVNTAVKTLAAINTGKLISKKDTFLEGQGETGKPISTSSAIFMAISGLNKTTASDIFALSMNKKNQDSLEKTGSQLFTREWRRMYEAMKNNDIAAAEKARNNAYYALKVSGIPEHKWSGLMSQAVNNINRPLREQMDWDRLIKDSPPADRNKNMDTFRRIIQQRNQ